MPASVSPRGPRRWLCILLALLVVASCKRETVAPSESGATNIILVTIDTLRADSVGFAGNAHAKTPFLDRLAAEGIVFTNAHAHNVVTLPSHANILTGLYPYQHGVRENAGFKLDPKHDTIANMLKGAGFTTAAFVGALPLDARYGLNRGFDVYDDNYGKGAASLDFVVQERPAGAVLEPAVRWWRENEGKKRFLWVHLYDPHAPYRAPEPFATEFADRPYLGEVAAVDDQLAKHIGPLLTDDTLVVVTADHGEALGDHGELTHGLFAYEPTLKVPLVVWRRGVVKHRVEKEDVRHIDIVPTLLEAVGVKKPSQLQGESLFAVSAGRDAYFEALTANLNRGWAPLTGIIHGRLKYIDLPLPELYDLPHDPAEEKNLRNDRRREVEAARAILAKSGAGTATANRKVTAEEAAQLRSLGYVSGTGEGKASYTAADDPKNLVDIDNKMHQVIDAYERHDIPGALKLAKEVVAARPNMGAGRELLAFVLQQSERVSDAIENLRAAIRSGTASESVRVQLGLLLTEQGKTREAVEVLAPLASGNDPDALNAYGIALADEGKLDAAVQQFQRVLQTDPNNAPAMQNLGIVALRGGDVASAQRFLTRALELNPRLPLALNTMGVVYARQGDLARAVDSWNRAVAVDPRQYDALFNIGLVEGRSGHVAEARAALSRFVETAPKERYGADIATARKALASLQ